MTTTEQRPADPWADHDDASDVDEVTYHHGYTDGHAAGLAARPPATVWAPHTLRWRHVRPGDGFTGKGGALWHVVEAAHRAGQVHVRAVCGERTVLVSLDPDETVTVLLPVPEVDAITLTAEMLGARIMTRRNDAPG